MKIWYGREHGTAELPVAPELHRALCLPRDHLARLHALAERCCATWGADLDIEWALASDGKVYLLQSRTVKPRVT